MGLLQQGQMPQPAPAATQNAAPSGPPTIDAALSLLHQIIYGNDKSSNAVLKALTPDNPGRAIMYVGSMLLSQILQRVPLQNDADVKELTSQIADDLCTILTRVKKVVIPAAKVKKLGVALFQVYAHAKQQATRGGSAGAQPGQQQAAPSTTPPGAPPTQNQPATPGAPPEDDTPEEPDSTEQEQQ